MIPLHEVKIPSSHWIFSCLTLFATYGVITYHVWIHRDILAQVWGSLALWIRRLRRPSVSEESQCIFEQRFDALRIKLMRFVLSGSCHMLVASLLVMVWVGVRDFEKLPINIFIRCAISLIFYIVVNAMSQGAIPLTKRSIDALMCALLGFLIYMVVENDTTNFGLASQRGILRILASVFYMSVFKAVLWNVVLSLVVGYVTLLEDANAISSGMATAGLSSEIQALVLVVAASIGICWLCEGCLQAQIEAEDAQKAFRSLLSVICDAVVQVDAAGKIEQATPHLRHLLHAGDRDIVDGTSFQDYLASESDRSRFEKLTQGAASTSALPEALHVDMVRCNGTPIPVHLFFAYRSCGRGQTGFLIGMRDAGNLPREGEVETPGQPSSQVFEAAHSQGNGRRRRDKPSRHSHSSSSSSRSSCTLPLPTLQSVSVTFDALIDSFPIKFLTLNWQGAQHQSAPTLRHWVVQPNWSEFELWAQTRLNELNTNGAHQADEDFGPLMVHCPTGGSKLLIAKKITLEFPLEDDEFDGGSSIHDTDTGASLEVTLKMQDFLQCSRPHRCRVPLSSIEEHMTPDAAAQQ